MRTNNALYQELFGIAADPQKSIDEMVSLVTGTLNSFVQTSDMCLYEEESWVRIGQEAAKYGLAGKAFLAAACYEGMWKEPMEDPGFEVPHEDSIQELLDDLNDGLGFNIDRLRFVSFVPAPEWSVRSELVRLSNGKVPAAEKPVKKLLGSFSRLRINVVID